MKFIINRELLLETINNVSKGLSQKTPMPILTGIKIIVEDKNITFIATNKEIGVKIDLVVDDKIQILEAGDCVIPGKYFLDIVKKIEGTSIDVELVEKSSIRIKSEKSEFTLIAYDKATYPVTNFQLSGNPIMFDAKELKQIIKQTSFACATSESRIVLTSINFKAKNGDLEIISTDSFRLAKKQSSLAKEVDIQANIPCRSLDEFNKILEDNSNEVILYLDSNKATFKYKNIVFVTRLVEGNYPDTRNLFPKESLFEATFNRSELINAVDRAALFTSLENLSIVIFNFLNSKTVEISSNSSEIGKVNEELMLLKETEDVRFKTAFSTKYLLDALKSFDKPTVTFYFTGEIKPTIIKSEEDPTLTQLLLPVRVFM